MDTLEKPKRKEKPKSGYRLNHLRWIVLGICLVMLGAGLFVLNQTGCACQPLPTATQIPCFWNWSSGDSPKDAAKIQAALESVGITDTSVTAGGDGEDLICGEGENATREFSPMNISPRIIIPVAKLPTPSEAGARIEQILNLMLRLPLPGLRRIEIVFSSGETVSMSWGMEFYAAFQALKMGIHGVELYEAGRH